MMNIKQPPTMRPILHSKIETYDIMVPDCFCHWLGPALLPLLYIPQNTNKAKKQLSFQPYPIRNGGGFYVSLRF